MLAQPVLVHGERELPGVVATMPPHMLTAAERKQIQTDRRARRRCRSAGGRSRAARKHWRFGHGRGTDAGPQGAPGGGQSDGRSLLRRRHDRLSRAAAKDESQLGCLWRSRRCKRRSACAAPTTAANHIEPDCAIALDVRFRRAAGLINFDETGRRTLRWPSAPTFIPRWSSAWRTLRPTTRSSGKLISFRRAPVTIPGRYKFRAAASHCALLGIPLRNMHSPVETLGSQRYRAHRSAAGAFHLPSLMRASSIICR